VAAKKLLGENAEYVVVTDQYAGYHYIDQEKRPLCWAHILRNVSALAQSWGTNIAIGKRLETIVNMLFRTRHRFENGDITELIYQQRMLRLQRSWRENLAEGSRLCDTPRYRNRCALLLKHDVMCWTFSTKPSRWPTMKQRVRYAAMCYGEKAVTVCGHFKASYFVNVF
jgi:transposase